MNAEMLTGRAAVVATLRVKLGVASKRAEFGATRAIREEQAQARDRYAAQLREMGEVA